MVAIGGIIDYTVGHLAASGSCRIQWAFYNGRFFSTHPAAVYRAAGGSAQRALITPAAVRRHPAPRFGRTEEKRDHRPACILFHQRLFYAARLQRLVKRLDV